MWYKVIGDVIKPNELDNTSSKKYVYIRKNFIEVSTPPTDFEPASTHWEWDEQKILKDDWSIFSQVMDHDVALDDVYAALTELAEIISEG